LLYQSLYPNAGLPNAFGGYDEPAKEDGRNHGKLCKRRFVILIGVAAGQS